MASRPASVMTNPCWVWCAGCRMVRRSMKPMSSSPRSARARARRPSCQSDYPASHDQHENRAPRSYRSRGGVVEGRRRVMKTASTWSFGQSLASDEGGSSGSGGDVVEIVRVVSHGTLQGEGTQRPRDTRLDLRYCVIAVTSALGARWHLAGPGRLPGGPRWARHSGCHNHYTAPAVLPFSHVCHFPTTRV